MSGWKVDALPPAYRWLAAAAPLPRMVTEALALYDVRETMGAANNPVILGWAEETGLTRDYRADAVAWCGLFMAVVAQRAGWTVPAAPLWALNWGTFGVAATRPMLGEDVDAYHLLGGNQGDRVGFARIARKRLRAVRRPAYRWPPKSATARLLAADGALSRDEA